MLLKRSIALAAAVLLFIVAFIIYLEVSEARMEDRFRAEREKFHVDHLVLTAAEPATPAAAPSAPATPAPPSTPTPDTNALIGPVPPSSSTPAPTDTNAAPDTNSAPANPAPSTMNDRRESRSPFFQLASYRPSDDAPIQIADSLTAATDSSASTPTAESPATNAAPSPAPTTSAAATSASTKTTPPTPAMASAAPAHSVGGEGKVIVLLYHQFKAPGVKIPAMYQWTMNSDVFESEMKYIHDNGYHVIPMSDLLKFLRHQITVPPNSVCITIDDGYKSAIVYAYPILKKYGFPWTFFIYPDFVTVGEGPGAASWKDLLALQADGVDIESHSMTHPNLKLHRQKIKGVWHSFTPEEYAAWLNNETAGSKALLEQKMGKPIVCFAYPYGEYNQQVEAAVIAAGYEAIFTVADNPVHASTDLHSIGRYTITQGVENNFAAYLRQGALGIDAANPAPGATITDPRPVITATLGYAGTLDPKSIETSVRDFGDVRHDFDPQTNMLRLYLPRDLIQSVVLVNIRVKDAATGQIMVANWHFNYEPDAAATAVHTPLTMIKTAPASNSKSTASTATNAPARTDPDPLEKSAVGTPLDAHPVPAVSPH